MATSAPRPRRALLRAASAAALLGLAAASPGVARPRPDLGEYAPEALDLRAHTDFLRLKSYTHGVRLILDELSRMSPIFDKPDTEVLTPDERKKVLALLEQVIAHAVGLESVARFHFDFWKVPVLSDPARHARHFALAFAAYTEQLRVALAFIDATLGKRHFEVLLDEGNPVYGLPAGAYANLKWNAVHVVDVTRLLSAHQYHRVMTATAYDKLDDPQLRAFTTNQIDSNYPQVTKRLGQRGVKLFGVNGFDILFDGAYKAWFPLQTGVAEWMGDTKVLRQDKMLIAPPQIDEAVARAQPGDILIERRNWYLSNIGLPGFWPHAALYIGSPEDLAAHLDGDEGVRKLFGKPFTEHLRTRYPQWWTRYTGGDAAGHTHRVIEAVSEGVVFTSAEHSLDADYAACLRPRLGKVEVARAIERAFSYLGRPYDFDFDFFSDSSLVCSELVYKAYEPRDGARGLRLPLEQVVGRLTLPPTLIVRQFDQYRGSDKQQLDFVWFLDGKERLSRALWADEKTFRASWRRLKWDVAQE